MLKIVSVITCEDVVAIVDDVTTQINPLPVDIVSGTSGSSVHCPIWELKTDTTYGSIFCLNFYKFWLVLT